MSDAFETASPALGVSRRNGHGRVDDPVAVDRLPPHAPDAERGVLGCCLLSPLACVLEARRAGIGAEGFEFYELRHRELWQTLVRMVDEETAVDIVTVAQRLRDNNKLEECGGIAYIAEHPDAVPSAANLLYYVDIVREKYVLRHLVGTCTKLIGRAHEWQGTLAVLVRDFQVEADVLGRAASDRTAAQELYIEAGSVMDELFARRFGARRGAAGLPLPELAFGEFPFLIRPGELTLVEGETKKGKSSVVREIVLHLARWEGTDLGRRFFPKGLKCVYDSREDTHVETFDAFASLLTGSNRWPLCAVGEEQSKQGGVTCRCAVCKASLDLAARCYRWLGPRLRVNASAGIQHWRDILDAWHVLADEGYHVFALDNLMRIGIAEDDYSGQSAAVSACATFAIDTASHVFLLNHRTKASEGDYRKRSSGSHKIAANAHNICHIDKNDKKFEKLAPWLDRLRQDRARGVSAADAYGEFVRDAGEVLALPDAKFYLNAQRMPGTQGNAARELWYLKRCGQYFNHRHERPERGVNWLERWQAANDE